MNDKKSRDGSDFLIFHLHFWILFGSRYIPLLEIVEQHCSGHLKLSAFLSMKLPFPCYLFCSDGRTTVAVCMLGTTEKHASLLAEEKCQSNRICKLCGGSCPPKVPPMIDDGTNGMVFDRGRLFYRTYCATWQSRKKLSYSGGNYIYTPPLFSFTLHIPVK